MRSILFLVALILTHGRAVAQSDSTLPPGAILAEFPGNAAQFLATHLHYPPYARDRGIQGRVVVRFLVSKTGAISDIRISQSVHETLDSEAIRVVRAMPAWKPAMVDGKAVESRFTLPIKFSVDVGGKRGVSDPPPEVMLATENLWPPTFRLAKASEARRYSHLPDWPGHLDYLPPITIQTETAQEVANLPLSISVLATISEEGMVTQARLLLDGDEQTLAAIMVEASKFWSAQAKGALFTPAIRKRDGKPTACEVIFEFPVEGVVQE